MLVIVTTTQKRMDAPTVRQVQCKSILGESGICDFAVNCYTGCEHACTYCYARFMGRFHHADKPWGSFVDAKVNAPEVLERQLQRRGLFGGGSVFMSSVCDAYQPAEREFGLTRRCLELLVQAGYNVHVQTKSALVQRDFDLLGGRENASLCMTLASADAAVTAWTEPNASPPQDRIETLKLAAKAGVQIKAFVGPLLPGLTDTQESLEALFAQLAKLPLAEVYVDRLNLRWGVWPAVSHALARFAPHALAATKAMLFSASPSRSYNRSLRVTVRQAAEKAGLKAPMNMVL